MVKQFKSIKSKKEAYKKATQSIKKLELFCNNILKELLIKKGLKIGTRFQITGSYFHRDKTYLMIDDFAFQLLSKKGNIRNDRFPHFIRSLTQWEEIERRIKIQKDK